MAIDSANAIAKIIRVRIWLITSGFRPAASTAFPPIIPMPMAGPIAPKPMASAFARWVGLMFSIIIFYCFFKFINDRDYVPLSLRISSGNYLQAKQTQMPV